MSKGRKKINSLKGSYNNSIVQTFIEGIECFCFRSTYKTKSPHLHPWNAVTLTYKRYIGQSCFISNIKRHNDAISMLSLLLIVKHDFYIIIKHNGRTKSFSLIKYFSTSQGYLYPPGCTKL